MSYERSLTTEQQLKVRSLRTAGWSCEAIARLYGVHRRTIYRYLEGSLIDVQVAGYTTTFWLAPDRTPRRAAPWRKSP